MPPSWDQVVSTCRNISPLQCVHRYHNAHLVLWNHSEVEVAFENILTISVLPPTTPAPIACQYSSLQSFMTLMVGAMLMCYFFSNDSKSNGQGSNSLARGKMMILNIPEFRQSIPYPYVCQLTRNATSNHFLCSKSNPFHHSYSVSFDSSLHQHQASFNTCHLFVQLQFVLKWKAWNLL